MTCGLTVTERSPLEMTMNLHLTSCEVSCETILGNFSLKLESMSSEIELLGNLSLKNQGKTLIRGKSDENQGGIP